LKRRRNGKKENEGGEVRDSGFEFVNCNDGNKDHKEKE
jgi:hypothetical protein